jgi:hypothetical protein
MSEIEQLLSIGDLRSAGKSEVVVRKVLADPGLFGSVVKAIFSDDAGTKMRASDAVEKITRNHPEWLTPYKKLFLTKIAASEQKEVRWHNAQILPRLKLSGKEREKVFNLMLIYLEDKSSIVRTFAMQALADIALQDKSYKSKVYSLIIRLMENGSPAMKSRGKKLIKSLSERHFTSHS